MDFPTFTDSQGNVRPYMPASYLIMGDKIAIANSAARRARIYVVTRGGRFHREWETARMWAASASTH